MLENNINVKTNNYISENLVNKPKIKTEVAHEVVDPTKVTKTAKQDADSQVRQELFNYNPNSVFDKFIKSLQSSPVLSESIKKLLLNKQFINNNIKTDPLLSMFFESFLENIEMNDGEILDFLKFQQSTYNKFQGEFFEKLRNLLINNPNNEDLKSLVKNFLRTYDCFVSVEETNKSINTALKHIRIHIPEILRTTLDEMTEKLYFTRGSIAGDLNILKNEIIPFLGSYISKMNDFGLVRDYVSVLVHNLIRLEFAADNNFSDDLENLFDFLKYNFNMDEKQVEELKISLITSYENLSKVKNSSMDSFLSLLEKGALKSESPVNRSLMADMNDSLLLGHNVNIPLIHMFLPLSYRGMFMFSEIWIGKESSREKTKDQYYEQHKAFITFDIQHLGYFEMILVLRGSKLFLDIQVPGNLSIYGEKIKKDLNKLLSKNNIEAESIQVSECVKVRRFNEVFSNLTERKNSVDVTI
ncbi:MAG: hypothetical protein GX339_09365 [Tissierellia bacterium]|nr:hypothetical protein [Tissierellia bacterium]